MVAWLKRVIRDGGESPERAYDAETTCPVLPLAEWSRTTSRTIRSVVGRETSIGLLDIPMPTMLAIASYLGRGAIKALVAVDARLRDYLIPELPPAAPRGSGPSDALVRSGRRLPIMTKGDMREHLVANVMRASASRCLTSPKAASSLPQELLDSGFELAEEARPQLGEGSFARVSLVVRKDKFYALKTVTKGPLEARNMAEHMKREVSLHSRMCTHPNIVALHDYFEDSRRIYMLLEWCPFGSLSGALATLAVDSAVKTLPLSITACTAAIIIDQLAAATRYLHDNGVIHRDIKPDNILISNLTPGDIQIRLTDFGWSCLENDTTQIYSKCGTPGFAAPEVFAGRQQTPASDIWSIGAVLRSVCGPVETYTRFDPRLHDLNQKLSRVDPQNRPSAEAIAQHTWMKWALEYRKEYSCAWLCQLVDHARQSHTGSAEGLNSPMGQRLPRPPSRADNLVMENDPPTGMISSPTIIGLRSPVLSPRSPHLHTRPATLPTTPPKYALQSTTTSTSPYRAYPPRAVVPVTRVVRSQWQPPNPAQHLVYTSSVPQSAVLRSPFLESRVIRRSATVMSVVTSTQGS